MPRTISPRLANGENRLSIGHRLPPDIKHGLFSIARKENKSVGWVLEEVIIDYFSLRGPKYVLPKRRMTK